MPDSASGLTDPLSGAKDLAREGCALLEEAVLEVLRLAEYPLRPAEVAERAGLFSNTMTREYKTNHMAQGVLDCLEYKGLVVSEWSQPNRTGIRTWSLAPADKKP